MKAQLIDPDSKSQATPAVSEHSAVMSNAQPLSSQVLEIDSSNIQAAKSALESPESVVLSTRATSTSGSIIRPLLKVSPPTPHGKKPGRYKVTLRRATLAQPFGVCLDATSAARKVLIGEDEERVGLRKGDEVLRINQRLVKDIEDANVILAAALNVELELQHYEQAPPPAASCEFFDSMGCETPTCRLPFCGERQVHQPRHSMRQLLSTSGPVLTEGHTFAVQIVRASLVQPFGLFFRDGPDEALHIEQDLPQYGLQAGDRVLNINSHSDMNSAQAEAILENSMNVWLECQREKSSVAISEALPLEDIDIEMSKEGVFCEGSLSNFAGIFGICCSSQNTTAHEDVYSICTDVNRAVQSPRQRLYF